MSTLQPGAPGSMAINIQFLSNIYSTKILFGFRRSDGRWAAYDELTPDEVAALIAQLSNVLAELAHRDLTPRR